MILSEIWKSGANIYLDKKDDRIAIDKQKLIPAEVMKAAEQNFQSINEWFQSWKDASAEKITLMKMVHQSCGWLHNEKLHDWLCDDADSLDMFYDWMVVLAENGWKDIYEDYRQFENDKSNANGT
jgi:NADH:ubiquinone oxidoreductase subunit E